MRKYHQIRINLRDYKRRILFDNIYITSFRAIDPQASAFASVIAPLAIIYIISTSTQGCSTIYHRIMIGMSIANIITSMATSLSAPSLIKLGTLMNRFELEENRLGSTPQTCSSTQQGFPFLNLNGSVAANVFTALACVYYLCDAVCSVQNAMLQQRVIEPLLHFTPLIMTLVVSIPFSPLQMNNPTPIRPWYALDHLQYWCENATCMRGIPSITKKDMITFVLVALNSIVIIMSLILVFRKVWKQNQIIMQTSLEDTDLILSAGVAHEVNLRHQATKILSLQSLAYAGALILTLLVQLLGTLVSMICYWTGDDVVSLTSLGKLKLIIQPLQGLLNFIIFVGGKIFLIRCSNPGMTYFDVFKMLFHFGRSPEDEDIDFIAMEGQYDHVELEFDFDEDDVSCLWDWDSQSLGSKNPSVDKDDYSAAVSSVGDQMSVSPESNVQNEQKIPSPASKNGKFNLNIQRRGTLKSRK
jgi:hypothetical protein